MPTYCYTCEGHGTIEKVLPIGKAPETIKEDGRVYTRDFAAEQSGGPPPACYPMYSESMGVGTNPRDIARARACGQNVDDRGRAIITSPENRRDWCRRLGMIDMN